MKAGRSRTILIALLIASVAAYGTWSLTKPAEVPPPVPTATAVPIVSVLVARFPLPAGTTLTAEMFEIEQITIDQQSANAVGSVPEAVGRVTAFEVRQGEQLRADHLEPIDAVGAPAETFAYTVPVGKRAFSIVFDEVIGVGGLVQPGDRVDIVAFFELDVDTITGKPEKVDTPEEGDEPATPEASPTASGPTPTPKLVEYTQFIATYIVQNVEVLAVAQALSADDPGYTGGQSAAAPTETPVMTVDPSMPTPVPTAGQPVARPTALSVTLAVTPEEAQRLMLAAMTVRDAKGGLRLALRAPGDTTIYDLQPAQLGEIPIGGLLGDLGSGRGDSPVVITQAVFTRTTVTSGELLEFRVTVKNTSLETTISSGTAATPGFVYRESEDYHERGFSAMAGGYRLGLTFGGASPVAFPYRWALGKDLAPGESVEVTGAVLLHTPTDGTEFWFGLIAEPDILVQDGVQVTTIEVRQPTSGTVVDSATMVLAEPNDGAAEVARVNAGARVVILAVSGEWLLVGIDGGATGWVPAAAIRATSADNVDGATPVATN